MGSRSNFQWGQVFAQWSLGMAVATPVIALIQGTILLSDYRLNFRDAPRPIMPASGVTVALASPGIQRGCPNTQTKPLRLLVVGDSLAAGVGISKSGIPILPESIAGALSKAFGGRAVYWTCVGTPGISASQIVHDINNMESREPRRLEMFLEEWQARRKKWKRRQGMEAQYQRRGLQDNDGDGTSNETLNHLFQRLRKSEEKVSVSEIGNSIERISRNWWQLWTLRCRKSLSDIQGVIQDGGSVNEGDVDSNHEGKVKLVRKGNLFRRNSLDPALASQYDIAVVLLGLNDLKDAFMPHMTTGLNASIEKGTKTISGGLNTQLHGVLQALQKKMGALDLPDGDPSVSERIPKSTNMESKERQKPPLVVVPELPVAPLEAFQLVPLCWFLVPLFHAMESNKEFLSSKFPDHVAFVHQPDLKWWSEVQSGVTPIDKNLKEEESLLRLTNIAQTAQKEVRKLMSNFYNPGSEGTEMREREHTSNVIPSSTSSEGWNHATYKVDDRMDTVGIRHGKFTYVAQDKMHPNDEGYEIWGHHIAAAVVRRWNS
eukprot:scaffold7679_cov134-Cylindrotheca_fusiformis.AAC.2